MTQIATYNQARALKHALSKFGIQVMPETFDMRTSGIYIPRWLGYSNIPHYFDPITGTAQWYFFFRFLDGHADINVGEALDFSRQQSMKHLALKIKAK
jgi:hypothetical protein